MKKHTPLLEKLFDKDVQLIDGTDEIFELDLALWEYEVLSEKELLSRSAYFKLINGKEFADNLCKKIAKEVAKLKDQNIIPGLAVVRVGEDSASKIYINMKAKKTEEIGMNSYAKLLSEDTDEKELIDVRFVPLV